MKRASRIAVISAAVIIAVLFLGYWSGGQPPRDAVAAGEAKLGIDLESRRVSTNGIDLHIVEAGPKEGPPVVLLHGFPEFWWAWIEQIGPLAKAGFRVIVPDQRGYNESDKPLAVADYQMATREQDIIGLIDSLGYQTVYLAGHDVGGSVAWHLVIDYPDRFRKFVVFDVAHPLSFRDVEKGSQRKTTSWHRTLAQLPYVAEYVARFANWALIVTTMRGSARPGTFPNDEMKLYRSAWARPGANTGMANWLRAQAQYPGELSGDAKVRVPTLIVWGLKDEFADATLARPSLQRCTEASLVEIPDAGHWLLHEQPERTSREMIEFFNAP